MLKKIHGLAQKFEEFSMENGIQRLFKDFSRLCKPCPLPSSLGYLKDVSKHHFVFFILFHLFSTLRTSHVKSVRRASSIKIITIINCTIIHYTHKQVSLGLHIFLLLSIGCHGLVFELEKAAKHYSLTRATRVREPYPHTDKQNWMECSLSNSRLFFSDDRFLPVSVVVVAWEAAVCLF